MNIWQVILEFFLWKYKFKKKNAKTCPKALRKLFYHHSSPLSKPSPPVKAISLLIDHYLYCCSTLFDFIFTIVIVIRGWCNLFYQWLTSQPHPLPCSISTWSFESSIFFIFLLFIIYYLFNFFLYIITPILE